MTIYFLSKCTCICVDFKVSEGGAKKIPQPLGVIDALTGTWLCSQYPSSSLQPPVTQVPGNPVCSSGSVVTSHSCGAHTQVKHAYKSNKNNCFNLAWTVRVLSFPSWHSFVSLVYLCMCVFTRACAMRHTCDTLLLCSLEENCSGDGPLFPHCFQTLFLFFLLLFWRHPSDFVHGFQELNPGQQTRPSNTFTH